MHDRDFAWVRGFLRTSAGLRLDEDKAYLAEARLEPLARAEGFPSLPAFIAHLAASLPNGLHARALEAMTTNETSFFRDAKAFDLLRERLLPELIERRREERRLTVWSAACSSGQEAYSLAMLLRDAGLSGWRVRILGSDLSAAMVSRARDGLYSQLEVNRGLPAARLLECFDQEGVDWRIRAEIREAVEFRVLNLLRAWDGLPEPDLILLRNVLLYLSEDARRAVVERARSLLRPGGFLMIGAAETLMGIDGGLERVGPGDGTLYRRPPEGGLA